MTSSRPRRIALVSALFAAILAISHNLALGQETAARPDRGVMPNGSYAVSDIENISLTNGNVNLRIPLASLPPIAGGKLSWTINAHYNSKIWNVTRVEMMGERYDLSLVPYVVDTPQLSDQGGWRISGQYQIEIRDARSDFDYQLPPVADSDYSLMNNYNWYRVVLRMPDGAEHELRPLDYSPFPGSKSFLFGYYNPSPYTHGTMRYYSFDGSYLYAAISSDNNWTVYLPDGTKVVQTTDGIQRVQDTNGNKIKIWTDANGTHYQDEQTGREIRVVYDASANNGQGQSRVYYRTVSGGETYIAINHGLTTVQGQVYKVKDWIPGQVPSQPCNCNGEINTEIPVIRDIELPATQPGVTRKISFGYSSDTTETASSLNVRFSCSDSPQTYTRTASKGWGFLNHIEMPGGAKIDYTYGLDSGHLALNTDDLAGVYITQKKLDHDGTIDTWTYSLTDTVATVTNPDSSIITENKHERLAKMGSGYGVSGLAYRTTKPFMKTERHWTHLVFSGANTASPNGAVDFNSVVDFEYTTLTDAAGNNLKMSAKAFQYDFNGNLTQTTEYDWFDPALVSRDGNGVPTGVPGSATVLRTTNNSYYNPATSSSSTNVYAKRSLSGAVPLILNALQQTTTGPAIVQLSYDGNSYGAAPTAGNLTGRSVWADLDNKWITTSMTYGLHGNVATATDARGKITQFFYDDLTHALPNRVVVDPQNGTGTQTVTTAFDYYTGLVTSQTDANNQISTINYTNQLMGTIDPFGRPGVTIGPLVNAGGVNQYHRVTTTYFDSTRQVIVASDLNTENDKLLKTRTTADMLGRAVLTEQTEDGTNYTISAQKAYDLVHNVTFSSNPRRSASATTDGWTRATSDTAGRVTEVATFSGTTQPPIAGTNGNWTGSVTTSYSANEVTVTDQAEKKRKSISNALGQLTSVFEDPAGLNFQTSYDYDVLGNLRHVYQGAQTRTFTYDSLSRLRSAVNPESGMITYGYDDSGNLLTKTDARNVTATYAYDALNRAISRSYSDGTPTVTYVYDSTSISNGKGRLTSVSNSVSGYSYSGYDATGKAIGISQSIGGQNYLMAYSYGLAGHVTSMTYPSGRVVSYNYDDAGRLADKDATHLAFTGNLGDGTTRTYAKGVSYGAAGQMTQEQFGTTTAVFNKLFYNSRGQLAEVLAATTGNDTSWNRGKMVNDYSLQCSGAGCNATDNNGNLRKQTVFIPNNEQNTSSTSRYQQYDYDSLNRLQRVHEYTGNTSLDWQQEYLYDRWGNRLVDTSINKSWGGGINNKSFTVSPTNNRLTVPSGQSGAISYDSAGNMTTDTYSGSGVTRVYDAENRMTQESTYNGVVAGTYGYDGDGRRVKRLVGGVETWQVYGLAGELVAEYAANGAPTNPQKEYGYRNGQLLVTAEPGAALSRMNMALAANGAVATASSELDVNRVAGAAINGDRKGVHWGSDPSTGSGWHCATANAYPDWLQIEFAAPAALDEINVFTIQDNVNNPVEPTSAMTFASYGITGFDVQYWNGSSWTTIPGGSVTGNNKVWRNFTFAPVTTQKIRVQVNAALASHTRVVEVEAFGIPALLRTNVARALNGGVASASSTLDNGRLPAAANNGDRRGLHWGSDPATGSGWHCATSNAYPDWLQIDFNGSKIIDEIDVFTVQNSFNGPAEPTEAMTFSQYGITAFDVQYWDGANWVTVPNGSVSGNDKVWRKFTFAPLTTSKIRVSVNNALAGHSRIVEVEAWSATSSMAQVRWLVTDHLGTPRMIFDQSGSLTITDQNGNYVSGMTRHDYLPFGEEVYAGTGGRTSGQGYVGDNVRQKFTAKERDFETGLDFMGARFYGNLQGRFTSVDPEPVTKENFVNPQRWNQYSYVNNNPLASIDPNGADGKGKGGDKVISVFIDLASTDLGGKKLPNGNRVMNQSKWGGIQSAASDGYRVDVYGNADVVTGNNSGSVNSDAYESALKNSEVVIYVGHGEGPGRGTDADPFHQQAISPGLQSGRDKMTLTNYGPNGKWTGLTPLEGKPEVNAKVVVSFSCDSSSQGGSYYNWNGQGQMMVTINSGKNGLTKASTQEKAARAFAKTYVATKGDIETKTNAAIKAADKVIQRSRQRNDKDGDRVASQRIN